METESIFGEINFNSEYKQYEFNADWCGKKAKFMIDAEGNLNDILAKVEEFYKNQNEWDKKIREFASAELTELANDWAEEEYDEDGEPLPSEPITEEIFAERISIDGFDFSGDEFEAFYYDDDMFYGHYVCVLCNLSTMAVEKFSNKWFIGRYSKLFFFSDS